LFFYLHGVEAISLEKHTGIRGRWRLCFYLHGVKPSSLETYWNEGKMEVVILLAWCVAKQFGDTQE